MFGSPKVQDVIRDLKRIESELPGAASRNPRLGFRKTIQFLEQQQDLTVDGLARLLAESKPKSKPKKPLILRNKKVIQHVQALDSARTSSGKFERAIAELESDTQVRLAELKAIVAAYTNDSSSFSKKAVGYGIIRQAFDQRWKLNMRSA